ncbi:hypothetical protein N7478_001346 [Penicillium angulare]|uniref:uncharacterized protein n=1 Tax=Penicillium angulare TaxID=116970 RepID=UPI00254068E4|nr:uncharacterized protein N7478_001346 [Penicillium angulare]KAJ5292095.1 hypothetical protein N7478_001346 [Penicillium angulare]
MNPGKPRIRAAKACKRCRQRKIKCDVVQNGTPCSRCRMDSVEECELIVSRRGTYDRRTARQLRHQHSAGLALGAPQPPAAADNRHSQNAESITTTSSQDGDQDLISETTPSELQSIHSNPTESLPPLGPESIRPSASARQSVSGMFEDFLNWRTERQISQCGLIMLAEPSPLTFALEEYPNGVTPPLHDASDQIRNSSNLAVVRDDCHPSHLDAVDITYLKAKGAFALPSERLMHDLVDVYLKKFHALYSIVDRIELEKVHKEKKLPWLMLHTVCFIGATFCDASVIHLSEFKSRLEARRKFYDRAKLIFDFGYETSKIIIAQCAIMLSFWGPQTHSYWNPCSWIGFSVTFAVSLGTHRASVCADAQRNNRGLLKKLWWSLVVRDTYCSVLLGRPFRINLTHCDTDMLTMDDFVNESMEEGFYQIQIARLSLILRRILHSRVGLENGSITPQTVHSEIEAWHCELQHSLQNWPYRGPPFICSTALDILYNYYLLLLYIKKPITETSDRYGSSQTSDGFVQSRARAIASHAITLVTKTKVCELPHELFPAFFVSGIVLYRQMRQSEDIVAEMARANLDNCRIILNEAKELWDPGSWAMQIFDFLCAYRKNAAPRMEENHQSNPDVTSSSNIDNLNTHAMAGRHSGIDDPHPEKSLGLNYDVLHSHLSERLEDYLLMPNFLPPATDEWPEFQI